MQSCDLHRAPASLLGSCCSPHSVTISCLFPHQTSTTPTQHHTTTTPTPPSNNAPSLTNSNSARQDLRTPDPVSGKVRPEITHAAGEQGAHVARDAILESGGCAIPRPLKVAVPRALRVQVPRAARQQGRCVACELAGREGAGDGCCCCEGAAVRRAVPFAAWAPHSDSDLDDGLQAHDSSLRRAAPLVISDAAAEPPSYLGLTRLLSDITL